MTEILFGLASMVVVAVVWFLSIMEERAKQRDLEQQLERMADKTIDIIEAEAQGSTPEESLAERLNRGPW